MHIGIDGLALGAERDGSWVYFAELVRHVVAVDRENRYTLFAQDTVHATMPEPDRAGIWQLGKRPPLIPRALYHQYYFARANALGNLDILHTAAFLPPIFLRTSVPQVLTLHDLNFLSHPETMKWTGRMWWRLFARAGIRQAACILASSEATRRDVKKHLAVPEEKIHVVYPCVRGEFARVSNAREQLARYQLPEKYILFVGTLEPRKNLENLVRAFALAKRQAKLEHGLVLAGSRGWEFERLAQVIEQSGVKEQIVFPGYVADEDLPALYSGADIFAFISWYEGFGFPVVEAMACGTPVIASNVSSLPEVLDGAGVLVDPAQPEEIASQIARVLTTDSLKAELSVRGQARAQFFSPERFRQELLNVYRHVSD